MDRRDFVRSCSAALGAFSLQPFVFAQQTNWDIKDIIDTINPQSHCNQQHAHDPFPYSYPAFPWQDQLEWSWGNDGYNEGAEAGVQLLLKYGLKLPGIIAGPLGEGIANLWHRSDMMYFARDLVRAGFVPQGAGLAILTQWHNCHAFRGLIFHALEVPGYLNN